MAKPLLRSAQRKQRNKYLAFALTAAVAAGGSIFGAVKYAQHSAQTAAANAAVFKQNAPKLQNLFRKAQQKVNSYNISRQAGVPPASGYGEVSEDGLKAELLSTNGNINAQTFEIHLSGNFDATHPINDRYVVSERPGTKSSGAKEFTFKLQQ